MEENIEATTLTRQHQLSEPEPSPKRRRNYSEAVAGFFQVFSNLTNGLDKIGSILLKLVMIGVVAMLVPRVVSQLTGNYVVFKEVNLPADIEKNHITKTTVQNVFIRNLKKLRDKDIPGFELVTTSLSKEDYSNFLEGETNLIMAASGFSIQAVVDLAADFFGIEQNKISLDVIDAKKTLEVHALVGKNEFTRWGEVNNRDDMDMVLRDQLQGLAEDITEVVDPVFAGIHYMNVDNMDGLESMIYILQTGAKAKSVSSQKWGFIFKAWLALRANEFQESLALAAQAKNLDSNFVVADWVQLRALVQLARYEDAKSLIGFMQNTKEIENSAGATHSLQVELARMHMIAGEFDEAELILSKVLQKQSDFAYALATLAELYVKNNKLDKALYNLGAALYLKFNLTPQLQAGVFSPLAQGATAKEFQNLMDTYLINIPKLDSQATK